MDFLENDCSPLLRFIKGNNDGFGNSFIMNYGDMSYRSIGMSQGQGAKCRCDERERARRFTSKHNSPFWAAFEEYMYTTSSVPYIYIYSRFLYGTLFLSLFSLEWRHIHYRQAARLEQITPVYTKVILLDNLPNTFSKWNFQTQHGCVTVILEGHHHSVERSTTV